MDLEAKTGARSFYGSSYNNSINDFLFDSILIVHPSILVAIVGYRCSTTKTNDQGKRNIL